MILNEIVRRTEERIAALKDYPASEGPIRCRSLEEAILSSHGKTAVIAEIKYASPSSGFIRQQGDVEGIARELVDGGCIALSIVTEPFFFQGRPEYLKRVRTVAPVPLLRKDFIFDERQIHESAALGADAVLLIGGLLQESLPRFVDLCLQRGLEPLVEVHTGEEADRALETDASLIGINNRNLHTMEVRLETTRKLSGRIRRGGRIVVAESGFRTAEDVRQMKKYCDAFLIGSRIMESRSPGETLMEFVCA